MIGVTKNGAQEHPVFFVYDSEIGQFIYQQLQGVYYVDSVINNIVANDFNDDEYIDLMITFTNTNSKVTSTQLLLYDINTSIYKKVYEFNDMKSGILIADLGSSRGLNFLFYNDDTKSRQYLYFDDNNNPKVQNFSDLISSNTNTCDRSLIHNNFQISNPHSSAFVDIDGDCVNDILISSKHSEFNHSKNITETITYLEIWRGIYEGNSIKYCLTQSSVYPLDNNLGLFTLADVNRDSLIDIVFPVLNTSPPQILVAYNKIELTYDWTQDYCADHKAPTNDNQTGFTIPLIFDDLTLGKSNSLNYHLIQLTSSLTQTFLDLPDYPAFLRFGDINQDSYIDFTTVLYDKTNLSQVAYVFLNTAAVDINNNPTSDRSFSKSYIISGTSTAIYSSFFDFDEDGKLDLILVKQESNNMINTEGYYNLHSYDSFYLKSMILNQQTSFFGFDIGTSFRYITTNIDGTRRMDFGSQAAQISTRMSMSLPYALMGIGRSNNYIENFHVITGNYFTEEYNYKIFTPLIPNSQIIIRHYRTNSDQSLSSNNSTNTNSTYVVNWHLDLLVKPTSQLPLLITFIILILSAMFFAIAYLHVQETKEDNVENQREFQFW